MATPPLYILVRLWIRRGLETEFEAYERKVSRVMARYGGVIERAIRTLRRRTTDQTSLSRSTCSSFRVGTSTMRTGMMPSVVL